LIVADVLWCGARSNPRADTREEFHGTQIYDPVPERHVPYRASPCNDDGSCGGAGRQLQFAKIEQWEWYGPQNGEQQRAAWHGNKKFGSSEKHFEGQQYNVALEHPT
jgi:hypothetical protein